MDAVYGVFSSRIILQKWQTGSKNFSYGQKAENIFRSIGYQSCMTKNFFFLVSSLAGTKNYFKYLWSNQANYDSKQVTNADF